MAVCQIGSAARADDHGLHRGDGLGGLLSDSDIAGERRRIVQSGFGQRGCGFSLPVCLAPIVELLVDLVFAHAVATELVVHLVEADRRLGGVDIADTYVEKFAFLGASVR